MVQPCILTLGVCHTANCLQIENKYYKSTPPCFGIPFMQECQVLGEDQGSPCFFFLIKLLETVTNTVSQAGTRRPSSREPPTSPKEAVPWHLYHFITYRTCVCQTMLKSRRFVPHNFTTVPSLWAHRLHLTLASFHHLLSFYRL